MDNILFLDTNALLNLQEKIFKQNFAISQKTLEEIENIKVSASKDNDTKYKARNCARLLRDHYGEYDVVPTTDEIFEEIESHNIDVTSDTIILAAAVIYQQQKEVPVLFITDDVAALCLGREVFKLWIKNVSEINTQKEYTGYKEIVLSDEEMSYFYLHLNENHYDSLLNEYLIIKNSNGFIVDYRKWNGYNYTNINYKRVNSHFLGKIKPLNPQQVIAFDMLQNHEQTIKVLSGRFGSGKDYIMLANALKMIEDGEYDKMIYIRNPIGVKDAREIGYLPGDKYEKLKPYAMAIADHLGGEEGLDTQLENGTIEVEHLGHIRGRDFKHSIIYCTEAENLTKEHVQLLIGRVGEGSSLWMNGDFKQTDDFLFKVNNGLSSAIKKLAGHPKFGYVQLQKTERSETAAMADLLD